MQTWDLLFFPSTPEDLRMGPLILPQVPRTDTPVILDCGTASSASLSALLTVPSDLYAVPHPPSLLPVRGAVGAQHSVFFFLLFRRISCDCWKVLAKAKTGLHGYIALNPFRVSVASEPKGLS